MESSNEEEGNEDGKEHPSESQDTSISNENKEICTQKQAKKTKMLSDKPHPLSEVGDNVTISIPDV